MIIAEQNLSRLFQFFAMTTCAFVSAEISMDTVSRMEALGRHDFFEHLSTVLGKRVDVGQTHTLKDTDIHHYNHKASELLKGTPIPYIKVRGAYSYDGQHTSMENTQVFIGLSNAQAGNLAAQFYQRAYIFVNRGSFYYMDSVDCKTYSITASAHAKDGKLPVNVKAKHTHHDPRAAKENPGDKSDNNPKHLFKEPGSDAVAGTIHGNKSFMIKFQQAQEGGDTMQALENALKGNPELGVAMALLEGPEIFVPNVGPMSADQAHQEMLLWLDEVRGKVERREYRAMTVEMSMVQNYWAALRSQT